MTHLTEGEDGEHQEEDQGALWKCLKERIIRCLMKLVWDHDDVVIIQDRCLDGLYGNNHVSYQYWMEINIGIMMYWLGSNVKHGGDIENLWLINTVSTGTKRQTRHI